MGTHWNIEDEGRDAKRVTECQEQDRKKKLWQTARNPICVSGSTGEKNRESNEVGQIYGEEIYIYIQAGVTAVHGEEEREAR